ncbi:helix-turn-helix domain-containing protein [Nitratireductor thuwali]|uniref:HTH-type transcriptional activator Btr n=1 Tax=Nitratireductor thuwali TaxID=2267699 RepID=A0ABY5MIM0_9HYPH|nr:HTH-type transcriptional activator Btr [Nitratireductor thuwali]
MADAVLSVQPQEFTGNKTHGFAGSDHSQLHVTSEGLGWSDIYLSRLSERPHQRSYEPCAHPMIGFSLNGPASLKRTLRGRTEHCVMRPGSFGILPAGLQVEYELEDPVESLHIYLHKRIMEEVAADLFKGEPGRLDLIPRLATFDSVAEHIAQGIYEAVLEPPPPLYLDHLGRAFAARLLRMHSTAAGQHTRPRAKQGLTRLQIKKVRELVEARLAEPLSLSDLAQDSGMTPSHFARLFKKSMGLTPYQYVILCRVKRTQRLLAHTSVSISSIAIECGFADQMHLTRTFRRLTGVTPASFRRERKG